MKSNRDYIPMGLSIIILTLLALALTDLTIPVTHSQDSMPTATSTRPSRSRILRIQELMLTNGDCTLPCFWGFNPDEATASDIDDLLSRLGADVDLDLYQVDGYTGYNTAIFFNPDGYLSLGFSIRDRDRRLVRTSIKMTAPEVWLPDSIFELPEVLNSLGQPTDVFILIAGTPLRYSLNILYNDQGVMLRYHIDFGANEPPNLDAPLSLCPTTQQIHDIYVWLQSPDDEHLVEENQPDLRDADRDTRPYWPLERLTGIDVEEFTQFIIDNPDGCIEALSLRELRDLGYQI
jgi:hypothetical protein